MHRRSCTTYHQVDIFCHKNIYTKQSAIEFNYVVSFVVDKIDFVLNKRMLFRKSNNMENVA